MGSVVLRFEHQPTSIPFNIWNSLVEAGTEYSPQSPVDAFEHLGEDVFLPGKTVLQGGHLAICLGKYVLYPIYPDQKALNLLDGGKLFNSLKCASSGCDIL